MSLDADVVIVGGGFAGVTAARELSRADVDTVLIEARDRLGGRTWSDSFQGTRVEMGGGWIHWSQPHAWSEVSRYGIAIEEDDPTFDVVFAGDPPREHDPKMAFEQIERALVRVLGDDRTAIPRPYEPFFLAKVVRQLDALSVADRMKLLTTEEANWLTGLLHIMTGAPLSAGGYFQFARWMSLCGWQLSGFYDTARYRPAGGTRQLLDALIDDSKAEIVTQEPVVSICDEADRVRVVCRSGRSFFARACVVAVPVNVWKHIDFNPVLPNSHQAVSAAGAGKPQQDKVWIHVEGEPRRVFAHLVGSAPMGWFQTYKMRPDGTQLIVAFNADPKFDANDHDLVASTIRRYVPSIHTVHAVKAQAWGRDEYSRGGNTFWPPGIVSQYLTAVQAPVGRLTFAGADIANGWVGYIDGAIETGIAAARAACEILRR